MISGSPDFIEHACGLVGVLGPVLASVALPLQGMPPKVHRKHRSAAQTLLRCLGLRPVFLLDLDNGGATDACHLFGFGLDLGSDVLPSSGRGLPLMLRHFLDGGTKGYIPPACSSFRPCSRWWRTPHGGCFGMPRCCKARGFSHDDVHAPTFTVHLTSSPGNGSFGPFPWQRCCGYTNFQFQWTR